MFKQFLAGRGADRICQIDACRLGGVNEVVAVLLLAAKFGVPVCPHAGGVGLCELVQHLSAFDYIAVSGRLDGRMIEYVDHLHEHFVDPVVIRDGRYRVAHDARLQRRDAPRVAGHLPLPERRRVAAEAVRPGHPASGRRRSTSTNGCTPIRGRGSSRRSTRRTSGTTRSIATGRCCSPTTSTSAATSTADMTAMAADPIDPAMVDADRRDAGAIRGPGAGHLVAHAPGDLPHGLRHARPRRPATCLCFSRWPLGGRRR